MRRGATRHRVGRVTRLNCWACVALLLLRGRLRAVLVARGELVPHLAGVTRRGNLIHFCRVRGEPKRVSLLFPGEVRVAGPAYLAEVREKFHQIPNLD